MADMTQLATLGNLQRVVENMKVYVDSDKTVSIKGYLKKNNTHNFYNTSTPTEDTTPIFSFDVGEEVSLDQTNTTFVQEFEWSDENYPNSTNPNLDGQAVLVLATKSNDVVSYSFVNLETLVDTYKTKNTTTLSLDITDNEISGNVNISTEDGNAVVVKDDGLYVAPTAEIKVSETDGNIIEVKDDGIYVAPTDLDDYSTTDEVKELIKEELYTENTIAAHYEIADSTTPNALEVVADGTATDGQIEQSSVADIGASIGDFVVFVDEVTTTDTKYAEKTSVYSKSETDEKIAEAVTSGTVDLSSYVKTETLADYSTTVEADEKYVLDEEIKVLSESDVLALLNMSDEELANLTSLLSDTTIQIDKTWSSSKIYSELNTTLDSSKQYTLDELSKAIGASYKVVTSVDQMTDSKVLYLLKDADSGMYNIYVYDADTSTAELIGSFEINLDDYLKISDAEAQYVKQTDLVANYATKQEVVDGYATKTELQDAIADVEVEISTDENNQLENRENGLFVDSETVTISKADYDALSIEEKSNGKTYFVPDDETTEDGTDLTQFAKVSDLEEINSKIEETNNNLNTLYNVGYGILSEGITCDVWSSFKCGNLLRIFMHIKTSKDLQQGDIITKFPNISSQDIQLVNIQTPTNHNFSIAFFNKDGTMTLYDNIPAGTYKLESYVFVDVNK